MGYPKKNLERLFRTALQGPALIGLSIKLTIAVNGKKPLAHGNELPFLQLT